MDYASAMAVLAQILGLVWRFVLLVVLSTIVVTLHVVVYRVTFHPLARIPGPRLAAISNVWYGRQIAKGRMAQLGPELHKKYGDVVRVGPNEVWFNTPEAFDQIYCTLSMARPNLRNELINLCCIYRYWERVPEIRFLS
jgi:hypothetical protein